MSEALDRLANNNPVEEERKFQHYSCAKQTMRTFTDTGRAITFINFQFITDDEDLIEYLNTQIAKRALPGIAKGASMTSEEASPMSALKRRLRLEILAEQKAEAIKVAKGFVPNMGSTKDKLGNTPKVNPLGSNSLLNAAGSTSGDGVAE